MKVLGMSIGRKMGNSEILLKYALKSVEDEGHDVGFVRLHDYNIKPCTGCELCTKLGRSGQPVRCMYNWEDDDFYFLMSQIHESQGLIIAGPAYQLMPPGILTVLVNRLHCFGYSSMFANQHAGDPKWRKIVATIAVGGSDWQSLQLPLLNFMGTELICSQMNLVDQMSVSGVPAVSMVATRQDYLDRAALLGKHIASELEKEGPATYLGDRPETCPICHSDTLVLRDGRLACAICDVHGDPENGPDGKIARIKWDGGVELSRFSMHGGVKHDDAMLNTVKIKANIGYVFTEEQQKIILEAREKWSNYLEPVVPKH